MPIAVSDTSTIRALSYLGRLDLLPKLVHDVRVPPAVVRELRESPPPLTSIEPAELAGVSVEALRSSTRLVQLRADLDPGEAEVIALAHEVGAREVLMDEAFGRAVARRHGLAPVGVLGLLVRAKHDGHVERVQPLMDRLRKELRFFISDPLRDEILRLAGESGPPG